MSGSITARLARHAVDTRFEDLPREAVSAAKRSLLDAVGVMLGASGLGEGCQAFADQARDLGGRPESTVLGFGFKAPALAAALANGATAHALDYEDAYDGAPLHPNAAAVPAALAIAEARGDASGKDLIAALAIGCDIVCRLGLALRTNPDQYGFYPPPILGAFGAAAAAGRLLRLDEGQMKDAFALTLSQSIASAQFKTSPDSMLRAVRDAFSAQAGVQAAQLARRGVRGFDGVFEGKYGLFALYARGAYDPDEILAGLGKRFFGAEVSFKPWPACRGTHAFIEAAELLSREHGFGAAGVARMTFVGAPMLTMLVEPVAQKIAPRTAIDAKFSLAFTTAVQLVKGGVALENFLEQALEDPQVLALAAKSEFVSNGDERRSAMAAGELRLALNDGRSFALRIDTPRGSPENPLSDAALAAKFRDCARYAANPPAADTVERVIATLAVLEQEGQAHAFLRGL